MQTIIKKNVVAIIICKYKYLTICNSWTLVFCIIFLILIKQEDTRGCALLWLLLLFNCKECCTQQLYATMCYCTAFEKPGSLSLNGALGAVNVAHTHTHTHTHTHVGFCGLWGLSIGVMVFILNNLYVLLPYTYPTPKLSPHRRLCASLDFQKNTI